MRRFALLGAVLACAAMAVAQGQTGTYQVGPVGPLGAITVSGDRPAQVPEEYIVDEGDTLWEICDEYFGEPWRWPTVWALNPHITNPHWIYPGDVIRLRAPSGSGPAAASAIDRISYTIGTESAAQVSLNEGFIAEKQMDRLGYVSFAPTSREYLAEGDLVYLEVKDLGDLRVSQRLSVFEVLNDVKHPETGEILGRKVRVKGVVEVESVEENVARSRVIRSFTEMKRGLPVTELLDHYHVVSPRLNLIDLRGTVVDALLRRAELGQFDVVFLDQGAKDGVQIGNRFFVMRRGDGYLELTRETDEKLPWEQIGEALVVETQDRSATAIITRSAIEVRIGDRVVMQRHY